MSRPDGTRAQAVLLSAPQPAAVAVLQVFGPDAAEAIRRFWKPASDAAELQLNRIRYGRWVSGGERTDRPADFSRGEASACREDSGEDVVLCRVAQNRFELHCHGGRAAQGRILADLHSVGVDSVDWEPGVSDPLAAAAATDLLKATTAKAAAVLHSQASGRLTDEIDRLIDRAASISAEARGAAVDRLFAAGRVGTRLIDPFRVLLAGPPNAGKSTLLNRLLGWERAIVDAAPGTTRDALREEMSLGGWPLAVIDSAGLRRTNDAVESVGVAHALELASHCDCLCLLVDPAEGWTEWHDALATLGRPQLIVATKSDLDRRQPLPDDWLHVSGATGDGVDNLVERLLRRLGLSDDLLSAPVPFRRDQLDKLTRALAAVDYPDVFARELAELIAR